MTKSNQHLGAPNTGPPAAVQCHALLHLAGHQHRCCRCPCAGQRRCAPGPSANRRLRRAPAKDTSNTTSAGRGRHRRRHQHLPPRHTPIHRPDKSARPRRATTRSAPGDAGSGGPFTAAAGSPAPTREAPDERGGCARPEPLPPESLKPPPPELSKPSLSKPPHRRPPSCPVLAPPHGLGISPPA